MMIAVSSKIRTMILASNYYYCTIFLLVTHLVRHLVEMAPVRTTATNFLSLDVTKYGVIGDGVTDDTQSLQQLLRTNAGYDNNTGLPIQLVVIIPQNVTVSSYPLNLTSYTTLQVDGTLRARAWPLQLWPIQPPLRSYGTGEDQHLTNRYQAFLYALNASNIRITGAGMIDGNGPIWWNWFINGTVPLLAARPNLVQFESCTDIEMDSLVLRDSPFWTIHPVYCRNLYLHHLTIQSPQYAPNVDGIDPDSCQNVLIEYNDISCGDDHIAIKAGLCGPDYPISCNNSIWSQGIYATDNVTIRYNTMRTGMGIAIGSATSGSIRNVNIYNNVIGLCPFQADPPYRNTTCGWGPALHVKTTIQRGGVIENIMFRRNRVFNTTYFILVEMNYQVSNQSAPTDYNPTVIRNISFVLNNANAHGRLVQFICNSQSPCQNIVVLNNKISRYDNSSGYNPFFCRFVQSYVARYNSPKGWEDCLAQSMNRSQWTSRSSPTVRHHRHAPL